jgi:hypothetical protein
VSGSAASPAARDAGGAKRSGRDCRAQAGAKAPTSNGGAYDYDLIIIGCGVGGHGAALHAVEQVGWWVAAAGRGGGARHR